MLGKQLELFTINPLVGSGLILWLPKGAVIRGELETIRDKYADARRTEIIQNHSDLTIEDLIDDEVDAALGNGGLGRRSPHPLDSFQR